MQSWKMEGVKNPNDTLKVLSIVGGWDSAMGISKLSVGNKKLKFVLLIHKYYHNGCLIFTAYHSYAYSTSLTFTSESSSDVVINGVDAVPFDVSGSGSLSWRLQQKHQLVSIPRTSRRPAIRL